MAIYIYNAYSPVNNQCWKQSIKQYARAVHIKYDNVTRKGSAIIEKYKKTKA